MKKTFIIFVLIISFLFADIGISQQEKDSLNGWVLAPAVYGIVNYNTTKTYTLDGITIFINNGLPVKIQEYIVFTLGWQIEVPIKKIPKKISGEFFLEKTKNLNSVDVYLTVLYKKSWLFLGQMKKLEKDSAWHNFTWDLPDDFDSLTGISFSYQHNVISTDSTLGVIKLRNLCCDSDLVGISGPIQTQNPKSFELSQNYPNPFNPSTKIKFAVPAVSYVSLIVFNSLGQEVQTLVREEKSEGIYEVSFNASNLPSGTYFYRLQAGSFVETKKMILMK